MNTRTFAEAYCSKHGIPGDRFEAVVLARALYPHARLLAPILRVMWPQHFAADLDLVRGAGQLRRVRDFSLESLDYTHHPANQGGLRRVLRLRASTQRLRRLVVQALHDPSERLTPVPGGTEIPFAGKRDEGLEHAPRS